MDAAHTPRDTAPPLTKRQRRHAARLQAIVEEALQIVLEEGLEGLTILALAQRLEWSGGALYRYFASKDALLVGIQLRVLGDLRDDLLAVGDALREAHAGTPPEALALGVILAQAGHFQRVALKEPGRFALLSALQSDHRLILPDEEAAVVALAMAQLAQSVQAALKDAVACGALRDGDAVDRALLLWTSLQGLLQSRKMARLVPQFSDIPSLCRALMDALLLGWGADPDHLKRAHALPLPGDPGAPRVAPLTGPGADPGAHPPSAPPVEEPPRSDAP